MREWRRRRTIICVQPGGNGNLKDAFEKELNEYAIAVREFVSNGGRYLGTCMGVYLVGNKPGYDLGLGVSRYIKTPGATVKNGFRCKKYGYFTKPVKNITNRIFIYHKQVNNNTKSNNYSLKRQ
jgi:hypothetical protein